ncbi:MGS1 [Candida margitis]|uniref:MGS1 n=1 Tax=Candida margitis TaxID=1775924 RepID=UPI002226A5AB|nr:MGS1 [Candida margitis]KAI5961735.1 MGS1 [Candida margitis]
MEELCPICSKPISKLLLERHVNSCLDNQEVKSDTENTTADSVDLKVAKKRDAFSALGLKASTDVQASKKRKPMSESKVGNHINIQKSIAESKQPPSENDGIKEEETRDNENEPTQSPSSNNLAREIAELKRQVGIPLAHRLRPKTLNDFIGQEKLLGTGAPLRNIIKSDLIPSFILWGPPGCGKTTLGRIIAKSTSCKFVELSGASSGAKDLKQVFVQAENHKKLTQQRTILFVDEIHRYNKAVQDLLLPVVEKGVCTVIGATTENPSFSLNNALLSRMQTFVMEAFSTEAIVKILNRALFEVNRTRKLLYNLPYMTLEKDSFEYIASLCMGDSRAALNVLETVNAYLSADRFEEKTSDGVTVNVTVDDLKKVLKSRNFHQMYDKDGDAHYDIISAFHKSIRGSDADAAMFYLVKMLSGGEDPLFILRRMTVIASEDIGLRDSSCLPFIVSAKQAFEFVGMPEGEIILAHCTTKLARAPKSTKSYRALRSAQRLISEKPDVLRLPVPIHLRNAPTRLMKDMGFGDAYKYNPNYENGVVKQSYFPDGMDSVKFLEDTHLGTARDPDVSDERYKQEQAAVDDYNDYKQYAKEKARRQRLEDGGPNGDSNGAEPNQLETSQQSNTDTDCDEASEYSDDPDCTNNFGKSYDEFLDRYSQPDYFSDDPQPEYLE